MRSLRVETSASSFGLCGNPLEDGATAPLDHIPVHIHGGNIIPTQEPALNTDISRNNPFGLIVALDDQGKANGSLYYDDGDSFDPIQTGEYFFAQMNVVNKTMNYNLVRDLYPGMKTKVINTVRLLGANPTPSRITVDGREHSNFTVLPSKEVLVEGLNITATQGFTLAYA